VSRRAIITAGAASAGLLVLLLAAAFWMLNRRLADPYAGFAEPVVFDYTPGMSGRELADQLERLGVVRSRWDFLAARAWRFSDTLLAGEYRFAEAASVWQVLDTIVRGRVLLYSITIPEGLTRFETAQLIADEGYGEYEDLLRLTAEPMSIQDLLPAAETLEGCLFPETYSFPRDTTGEEIIARMTATFREALQGLLADKSTPLDAYAALIVASMVEKETSVEAERGLVSSVYHNRIERRMLMQCDPTIIYGLILEDRYRGTILLRDLKDPHPYNTYVHGGLPPSPIANPGAESLRAAFAPADSDYIFFVAKPGGSGDHSFSATLREHNQAVARLRAGRNAP
jgi:UPF0755 protein